MSSRVFFSAPSPWFLLISLHMLSTTHFASTTFNPIGKPNCRTKCGNLDIPYPFGIHDESCSMSYKYNITCNTTFDLPKAFLGTGNVEVLGINDTQIRIRNDVSTRCYNANKTVMPETDVPTWFDLHSFPMVFSDTTNKFTAMGCDDVGFIEGDRGRHFTSGCVSVCSAEEELMNGSCTGIGCCQTDIPKGVKSINLTIVSIGNHSEVYNFDYCGYAFLGEKDKFTFNVDDITSPNVTSVIEKIEQNVPIVLDWFVGEDETCEQASSKSSYACKQNSYCKDFEGGSTGYLCHCRPGYEGNPYLSRGCTDINECTPTNPCATPKLCRNTQGNYTCYCPKGHHEDGSTCVKNDTSSAAKLSLGIIIGLLIFFMFISWIYFAMKRRKIIKLREKFFEQNGGFLLKQQLNSSERNMESSKIFTAEELKAATNNYSEDRVLGVGGYGKVYKGILKDAREVAIKKSKIVDQSQIEQFVNEVVILTQINHRNVVKLLGCCLETDIPILVYEFISNGTLYEHIHIKGGVSWLTWANCVRLSTEVANALAYLHSAVSIPIIHRDIKTTNILLDESLTTKISDFGASRLVPIDDHTQVATLVQGTLGYLDPEYFQTGQFTDKSDVYSFGVLLAELLTKEKPLCSTRKIECRNLAKYFTLSVKEDRLFEILDPQLVREAIKGQLVTMSKLILKCLNVKGEDRPTMKEVAIELEVLNKNIKHPWVDDKYENLVNLLSGQDKDLYPIPSDSYNTTTGESSAPYSMETYMLVEMEHLR